MRNLARHEPDPATIEEVTRLATEELSEAGIEPLTLPAVPHLGEVPSRVIGALHGWTFERAWYYWRAEGPGLPAEVADRLHAAHGPEVRVNGDCGAPSPREVFHGLGVGRYHIDSQAGLNALAAALRSVVEGSAAPPSGVDREAVLAAIAEERAALPAVDGGLIVEKMLQQVCDLIAARVRALQEARPPASPIDTVDRANVLAILSRAALELSPDMTEAATIADCIVLIRDLPEAKP